MASQYYCGRIRHDVYIRIKNEIFALEGKCPQSAPKFLSSIFQDSIAVNIAGYVTLLQ